MTGYLPPAVVDDNGTVWYRPAFEGRSPPQMWGWTSDRDQAHPDYWLIKPEAVPPQPTTRKDTTPVHEMDPGGSPAATRYTEYMRYPLPPLQPREEVQSDGYGRYKLPSPTTGRPTSYPRATTISSVTSDDHTLVQWKIRTKAEAVVRAALAHAECKDGVVHGAEMRALSDAYSAFDKALREGTSKKINDAIDMIDNLAGGADSRELGQAVHDWIGAVAMGHILTHQVPEQFQPYVAAYQQSMLRAGMIDVPEYVERVVLNDRGEETVAGRIDGIAQCVETGELYLLDRKTSKTLDFSLLDYGIQFSIYGYATLMLGLDGLTWEPMPEINQDMCLCVHVPSDQPERSQVVPFDLYTGGEALITAIEVRRQRKEFPKRILGHTTPIPSERALRYVQARQALQSLESPDQATEVMETYGDVWDDSLSEFGATCFELLTATNTKEN